MSEPIVTESKKGYVVEYQGDGQYYLDGKVLVYPPVKMKGGLQDYWNDHYTNEDVITQAAADALKYGRSEICDCRTKILRNGMVK